MPWIFSTSYLPLNHGAKFPIRQSFRGDRTPLLWVLSAEEEAALIVSGEDGYKAGLRLTGIGLNRVSLAKSVSYAPPDKG